MALRQCRRCFQSFDATKVICPVCRLKNPPLTTEVVGELEPEQHAYRRASHAGRRAPAVEDTDKKSDARAAVPSFMATSVPEPKAVSVPREKAAVVIPTLALQQQTPPPQQQPQQQPQQPVAPPKPSVKPQLSPRKLSKPPLPAKEVAAPAPASVASAPAPPAKAEGPFFVTERTATEDDLVVVEEINVGEATVEAAAAAPSKDAPKDRSPRRTLKSLFSVGKKDAKDKRDQSGLKQDSEQAKLVEAALKAKEAAAKEAAAVAAQKNEAEPVAGSSASASAEEKRSLKKSLSNFSQRLRADWKAATTPLSSSGSIKTTAVPSSGGLQQDTEQAKLVQQAKKAKAEREKVTLKERWANLRKKAQTDEMRRETVTQLQDEDFMVYCTECGKRNRVVDRVCVACKEPLVIPGEVEHPSEVAVADSPRSVSPQSSSPRARVDGKGKEEEGAPSTAAATGVVQQRRQVPEEREAKIEVHVTSMTSPRTRRKQEEEREAKIDISYTTLHSPRKTAEPASTGNVSVVQKRRADVERAEAASRQQKELAARKAQEEVQREQREQRFALRLEALKNRQSLIVEPQLESPRSPRANATDEPEVVLDPNEAVVRGDGISPGPQGSKVTFEVEARDNRGQLFSSGQVDLEVTIRSPMNKNVRCDVRPLGGGRYEVSYFRALQGNYSISVRQNGVNIVGSPFRVESLPVLSSSSSVVIPSLAIQDGPQSLSAQQFIVELRDLSGEKGPFFGHKVDATIACNQTSSVFAQVTDLMDGSYRVAFQRRMCGEYTAHVTVDGESISGSPVRFRVHPVFDAAATVVRGLAGSVKQNEVVRFSLDLFDLGGFAFTQPASVGIACSGPDGKAVSLEQRQVGGTCEVSFVPQKSGNYVVSVDGVPESPFRLYCAQAIDPSRIVIEGAGAEDGVQSDRAVVAVISLQDVSGERITGLSFEDSGLLVDVFGPDGKTVDVFVRDTPDSFRARFTRAVAGEYRVEVRLHGSVAMVRTTHVKPNLDLSSVSVDSLSAETVQNAQPLACFIRAKDVSGKPLSGERFLVEIDGKSVDVSDRGDGSYEFALERRVHGNHAVHVKHSNQHVALSPYTIFVRQKRDPLRTTVLGAGIEDGVQSLTPCTMIVATRDLNGQPMLSGGAQVAVAIRGPSNSKPECKIVDNADGTFTASFVRNQAGTYRVTVSCDDIPVDGSPFRAEVVGEVDVSSVVCTGISDCKQGGEKSFTILCKDLSGEPLMGQNFTVSIENTLFPQHAVPNCISDMGDGEYVCNFSKDRHGAYLASVRLNNHHVAESPYRFVVSQVLDSAKTEIELPEHMDQSLAPAVGTIRLRDVFGDPLLKQPASSVSVTIGPKAVPVTERSDGTFSFEMARSTSGTHRVRVEVDGVIAAAKSVNVEQVSDPQRTVLADLRETLTQSTEAVTFWIRTFDCIGQPNARGGEPYGVCISGPRGAVECSVTDTKDGRYKCASVFLHSGVYSIHVQHANGDVLTQEVTVSQKLGVSKTEVHRLVGARIKQMSEFVSVAELQFFDLAGDAFLGDVDPRFIVLHEGEATPIATAFIANIFSLIPQQAGSYEVKVEIEPGVFLGTVIQLAVDQVPCVRNFLLDSKEPFQDGSQSDEPVQVVLQSVDLANNAIHAAIPDQTVSFTVDGPQGPVKTLVEDEKDGTYVLSFIRAYAGAYHAAIQVNSELFGQYDFVVSKAVFPRQCIVAGGGLDQGIFARKPAVFTVEFRDLHGALITERNIVLAKDVTVTVLGGRNGEVAAKIDDNRDGTVLVTYEPDMEGVYEIGVFYRGTHLGASPFSVKVEKPPKSGSIWQQKFESESEERRKQREKERLDEIAAAKAKYAEHAAQVSRFAKEKQEAEFAEKERLRKIEEHMELMRSEAGDTVRKQVLEKIHKTVIEDAFEPLKNDSEAQSKAGKRWALQQQQEHEERVKMREQERLEEIERAKQNYLEHVTETKQFVSEKERKQYEQEERDKILKAPK